MIEDWIPFHRRLMRGKKRSLPRGVRFVYLELALEARANAGSIELPPEWDTVTAVHDLLGGKRSEIKTALEEFQKVDDDGVSPLKIVQDSSKHTLIVSKWSDWAGPKSSTKRVREFRERQKNAQLAANATLHVVTGSNAGNALQQKTAENKTAEKSNGVALRLPGLDEIETEIRRHPLFAALDAHAIAVKQAERLITAPQKPAWLVAAIAECAEKSAGLGLTSEALTHKLVGFMRNAKRPKDPPPALRKPVETPDDAAPTDAELEANRKRMDERAAKNRAERERREKLGIS